MTSNSLTYGMKNTISPHKFWRPFWIACLSYYPICVVSCSLGHWLDPKLLWSIGRTNCSYYSTRVDLYSHQILLSGYVLASDGLTIHYIQLINSLATGKFEWNFRHLIFKQILVIDGWGISCEIALMNVTELRWWSVNIGSGNGLVPSGNKPLPEPMLTQISVTIWCH